MERKTISKKVPIILAIVWVAVYVLVLLTLVVYAFSDPFRYIALIEKMLSIPWLTACFGMIGFAVLALTMLPIFLLARKAKVQWLKILSMILLIQYAVMILLNLIFLSFGA